MRKTGHQIESDIFSLVKASGVMDSLDGGLYRKGIRPQDSDKEDLVVIFTTADGEQVQEGVVTLNAYVPDIAVKGYSAKVEDIRRAEEIEALIQGLVDGMRLSHSDYLFSLKEAVHTQREEGMGQSFVVAKIKFRILSK